MKKNSKTPPKKFIPQKLLSSILYPNNDDDGPLCGVEYAASIGEGLYIANIGQCLVDIDASNEKLGQMMDGLTIEKVVTDYLKHLVRFAIEKLQIDARLVENEHFKDFVSKKDIHTVSYCKVCPNDRQDIMKKCFLDANIINESETEHRLSFITEAVATAYYQLSLDRNENNMQNNEDYLFCDVSEISIGLAKVHAASTESISTVTEISDDITQGSLNLEAKFKDYLIENMMELNLNFPLISEFVDEFSANIKVNICFVCIFICFFVNFRLLFFFTSINSIWTIRKRLLSHVRMKVGIPLTFYMKI